tara:strand:- start:302 stop:628 length:327 start_codon:yes stop_codon:yes gene_type:complete
MQVDNHIDHATLASRVLLGTGSLLPAEYMKIDESKVEVSERALMKTSIRATTKLRFFHSITFVLLARFPPAQLKMRLASLRSAQFADVNCHHPNPLEINSQRSTKLLH